MNNRYYNFMILLYEEKYYKLSELDLLVDDYVYIKHDSDILENGENDKEHIHLICRFKNAKTISSIAKIFDIRDSLVEPIKNMNKALKYLIHYGYDEKYQYSADRVVYPTNNSKLYDKFTKVIFTDISSEEKIISIYNYITYSTKFIKYEDLLMFVIDSQQLEFFRRFHNILVRLLDEHNSKYSEYYDLHKLYNE